MWDKEISLFSTLAESACLYLSIKKRCKAKENTIGHFQTLSQVPGHIKKIPFIPPPGARITIRLNSSGINRLLRSESSSTSSFFCSKCFHNDVRNHIVGPSDDPEKGRTS